MATITARPLAAKRQRRHFEVIDLLVFLTPLLGFVILLYGALLWPVYASFTDWATIAPNYELTGLKRSASPGARSCCPLGYKL